MRALGVVGFLTLALPVCASDTVSFRDQILPLLENRCVKCHGDETQMAGLDLRSREAAGKVIVEREPEKSPLYRRVAKLDDPSMPMDGELAVAEVKLIRRWIEQGAPWESAVKEGQPERKRFWAFETPTRPQVPDGPHPVDAFLRVAIEKRGLKPAPMADKRVLIRRAYLDLIGLPPSPEEVDEFLADSSPSAWEKLIEKLLASPHYGERWGRHWLDVARYADSNGYEHDFNRPNAWRYRDYVVQSFNNDKPHDDFLREQIAGDELDEVTYDSLIATGFLRNYAKVGYREKDNPQYRFDYLDDMIATVGRGVLGLTVQCARCHDHKFDPIPQQDYYKVQASLFTYVEVDHPLVPPDEAADYRAKVDAVDAQIRPLRQQIRELEAPYRKELLAAKYRKFPANVQKAIATTESERTPGQILLANQVIRTTGVSSRELDRALPPDALALKQQLQAEIKAIEEQRPDPIPMAMGITDGDYRLKPDGPGDAPAPGKGVQREHVEGTFLSDGSAPYRPPPSYFLEAGDIRSRGELMQPGFLQAATGAMSPVALPPAHRRTSGRRRALAEWLVSRDNPLTARVFVNRIWHHHFGRGIVASLDNFGMVGDRPTHRELLDWLVVEFMDQGWSDKQMHRLLMTSRAYRMSSEFADPGSLEKDPENQYLWRFRAQRLEAEIVRDAILATSGALNREMGGPAVFPQLPADVLRTMKHGIWQQGEDGPEVWRRSIYVYRKRGLPFPFFEVFDLPDQNITCGRRNVSTVPTQALTLLNNQFVIEQARLFAGRVAEKAGPKPEAQLDLAYRIALSRPPTEEERRLGLGFLHDHSLEGLAHVLLNLNEFVYLR